MGPSVRHEHVQAAAKTPVELELHRVVGGAGLVVHDNDITLERLTKEDEIVAWGDTPSSKATAQSTHVSHRKCLLPEGLLYRSVPLPGVWEVVACATPTWSTAVGGNVSGTAGEPPAGDPSGWLL